MWTWQCSSQLGDGATVSFNVVNSPAFSSSLAFPFFVPGHLIAALICSSTRLPLPIYWYFMKITPLNRVNVCLSNPPPHPTSRRLPSPNVSPKTPRGYLVKTLATYGRLNSAFPRKPREMRGGGKRKAISGFASEPCLACSFPLECRVSLQPTATARRCPLIKITCTLYSTTYICQDNVTCRNKMFC